MQEPTQSDEMSLEHKAVLGGGENGEAIFASEAGEEDSKSDAVMGSTFEDLMRAFETFKQTNDDRFDQLEKRGSADALTEEKMARINQELDNQQERLHSLTGAKSNSANSEQLEQKQAHSEAFEYYVREGKENKLQELESKSLSIGSDADGGYLVPEEVENTISKALAKHSPIRSIASVRQISGSVFTKPFAISGAGAGWVGETEIRPQTGTPQLAELSFPTMELYAMPAATSALLEDSSIDIEQWVAEEVETSFGSAESAALVLGDGVSKPTGFLAYPNVANSSWSWGNLGMVNSGADGGFEADAPADRLIDLIYSLKSTYRANARFTMNSLTQAAVRKLKDGEGNYLWHPANYGESSSTLMGFSITEVEEMPDMAPDSLSIAFGDFRRGYLVVDRMGTRVLRDRFTAKPYVLFYATKRVGGGVQDFNAIKLLKFAAD